MKAKSSLLPLVSLVVILILLTNCAPQPTSIPSFETLPVANKTPVAEATLTAAPIKDYLEENDICSEP